MFFPFGRQFFSPMENYLWRFILVSSPHKRNSLESPCRFTTKRKMEKLIKYGRKFEIWNTGMGWLNGGPNIKFKPNVPNEFLIFHFWSVGQWNYSTVKSVHQLWCPPMNKSNIDTTMSISDSDIDTTATISRNSTVKKTPEPSMQQDAAEPVPLKDSQSKEENKKVGKGLSWNDDDRLALELATASLDLFFCLQMSKEMFGPKIRAKLTILMMKQGEACSSHEGETSDYRSWDYRSTEACGKNGCAWAGLLSASMVSSIALKFCLWSETQARKISITARC